MESEPEVEGRREPVAAWVQSGRAFRRSTEASRGGVQKASRSRARQSVIATYHLPSSPYDDTTTTQSRQDRPGSALPPETNVLYYSSLLGCRRPPLSLRRETTLACLTTRRAE